MYEEDIYNDSLPEDVKDPLGLKCFLLSMVLSIVLTATCLVIIGMQP